LGGNIIIPSGVISHNSKENDTVLLCANKLHIGSWEIKSSIKSELFALFDFRRQLLSWLFIDSSSCKTKNKIQIQIEDVCSMNLSNSVENNKVFVDMILELDKPPEFLRRGADKENESWDYITGWVPSADFTNTQASTYKRHRVRFVDADAKKVQALVQYNQHFKELMEISESGGFSLFTTAEALTFSSSDKNISINSHSALRDTT